MAPEGLRSVAVIPDGNRRYAKKSNISLEAAYVAGFKKVGEFSSWAFESNVQTVSFWALSLDNYLKRSNEELNTLFKLMGQHLDKALKHPKFKDYECSIKFFGHKEILPSKIQEGIDKVEERTAHHTNYRLNIGIAYSGRDELLQASKRLASDIAGGNVDPENIDEKVFNNYLYLQEQPQLIIRTGNVARLSGFLAWQNAYSELYFSPKLWPEFNKPDFQAAREFFNTTEQRFGK